MEGGRFEEGSLSGSCETMSNLLRVALDLSSNGMTCFHSSFENSSRVLTDTSVWFERSAKVLMILKALLPGISWSISTNLQSVGVVSRIWLNSLHTCGSTPISRVSVYLNTSVMISEGIWSSLKLVEIPEKAREGKKSQDRMNTGKEQVWEHQWRLVNYTHYSLFRKREIVWKLTVLMLWLGSKSESFEDFFPLDSFVD